MILKKQKIFITGGAGFIGSNLIDSLIKDNYITVYDNLSSGQKSYLKPYFNKKNFRFIKGNLLDTKKLKKAIKKHDIVWHLAANPDIAKSMKQPRLDFEQGIMAIFNVLEAMRINKVRKIVFASGSGVYGDQGTEYTAEDFGPLLPVSMYGASKLAAEGLISAFCYMFDMQGWIFRPANIVGRRQTHGVGLDFIKKLKKNPKELKILGDGTQSKSYIHVDDFIGAMLLVVRKSNDRVNLLNVALNTFTSVKDIARIVVEEMGLKNVKFKYTGGSKGWKGDVPKVRMDIKKIKKLGWRAKLTSNQAIKRSIKDLLLEA